MRYKNHEERVRVKFDRALEAATDGHVVKAARIMSSILEGGYCREDVSADLTVRCWTLTSLLAFDFRDEQVLHQGFQSVWGLCEYDATKIIAENTETGLALFATQIALESEIAAEGDDCPDLLEHRRLFFSWARAAAVSIADIDAAAAYADGWIAFAERRFKDAEDAFELASDESKETPTRLFVRPCVRALAKADLAVSYGRDPYAIRESLFGIANGHRELLCAPSRFAALARLVALFPEDRDSLVDELTSVRTPTTTNQISNFERMLAESRCSQFVANANCLRHQLARGLEARRSYVRDLATVSLGLLSNKTVEIAPISSRGAWLTTFNL